jgi:hypothetical protein
MPSQLITPPDKIPGPSSFILINILDDELENLVAWLKTHPVDYNIHLYHCEMEGHDDWIVDMVSSLPKIIVSVKYKQFMPDSAKQVLEKRTNDLVLYGPGTDLDEPVDFFIKLFDNI